jgi:hypothetical protein
MSFDAEPDGECALEIHRLTAELAERTADVERMQALLSCVLIREQNNGVLLTIQMPNGNASVMTYLLPKSIGAQVALEWDAARREAGEGKP